MFGSPLFTWFWNAFGILHHTARHGMAHIGTHWQLDRQSTREHHDTPEWKPKLTPLAISSLHSQFDFGFGYIYIGFSYVNLALLFSAFFSSLFILAGDRVPKVKFGVWTFFSIFMG